MTKALSNQAKAIDFLGEKFPFKGLEIYNQAYAYICRKYTFPPPRKLRKIFDLLQKNSPLLKNPLPEISLGIVCHPKDFGNLELVISQAINRSRNRITEIVLVTTREGHSELKQKFPKFKVLNENEFLEKELLASLESVVPLERYGWVLQQIAKFLIVMTAKNEATLILDADTLLLKDTSFLGADLKQAISYSDEYHVPYVDHYAKFVSLERDKAGHSFVTHYQLMQRDVVTSMLFSEERKLINWIQCADFTKLSPLSEYHCYGEHIVRNYKERVQIVRWGNRAIPMKSIELILNDRNSREIEKAFPSLNSISIHTYL
jgi:hypothetical protein